MTENLKNKIIEIGKLLWDKGLAFGFNGNISMRLDSNTILITATGTCLGMLKPTDILPMTLDGQVIGEGKASSERFMHTEIYKNLAAANVVVHSHTTYTNGFFLANDSFEPKTFEAKFYLGHVKAIAQFTPSVTEVKPVIDALKTNNIVVLKNHGVVSIGDDLFNAFVLIQELEEQVKMDLVAVHYSKQSVSFPNASVGNLETGNTGSSIKTLGDDNVIKKYDLFAQDQIAEIVKLVNNDSQMKELGLKTAMNMDLAVCLQETGLVHSFKFNNGQIVDVGHDANAEFLITANETIWRAVFNREIDPFVATTQKKMSLRGDFARISKWYAPCSRIFQLWAMVPVK